MFSLFKKNDYQPIREPLLSEELDYPIVLDLKGETVKTSTNQITKWLDFKITITETKEVTGSGISLFNGQRHDFFIVGKIEGDQIEMIKSFPYLKYHIKYKGTIINKNNKFHSIQIFSDHSFGILDVIN